MGLMAVLGILLVVGTVLAVRWGGTPYQTWVAASPGSAANVRAAALTYLRAVAIALVAGFWTGALVTGPAMRLIMRLLAVTAGDSAQGSITEADQIVGDISLDGTFGLYIFGGILPALLSGALYVLVRRWLPAGRAGGVVFGLLHLIIGATRVDPLRAENLDFRLVGPGWLSVLTFGAAAILHGMAVAAFANRYSASFPPAGADSQARKNGLLPLVLPGLFLIPGFFLLLPIGLGLVVVLVANRLARGSRLSPSPRLILAGRIAISVLALLLLPGTVQNLVDIIRA
ncbi:MAG: hypothetical protein ABIM89_11750 [Mycobacteriales bacterium]